MKLCIIGPEKRTESELMFIRAGKKIFGTVFYIPFSNVSLNMGESIRALYKHIDITGFDALLPRIPGNRAMFGCTLINILNMYSPISSNSFSLLADRFLMMSRLKRNGVPVPKMYLIDSSRSIKNLISTDVVKFPISLKINSSNITVARNLKEAKTIMDALGKFRSPLYIEEFVKKKIIQAYVVGDNVVACVERKPERKTMKYLISGKGKLSDISRKMAINSAKALETNFARIDIADGKVVDISLCPDISIVAQISGLDVAEELVSFMKQILHIKERPVFTRILDEIGALFKVKDLIGQEDK